MKFEFEVKGMTCGHCMARVTKAVQSVDPQAKVEVDLANRLVHVDASGEAKPIADAITQAGYPANLH